MPAYERLGREAPELQERRMHLTAMFLEVAKGYIAFVEELPGANTQGATLYEARENLREAVALVLEANREIAARGSTSDERAAERP